MLKSSTPPKFPIPWGFAAGTATIRDIPVASQIGTQAGAASLTDGFPPLNLTLIPAGGVPPFGQDMNGILRQVTKHVQWLNAGGSYQFDAAFASFIGGYQSGALLMSNSGHAVYENLIDSNSNDPNVAGAPNWRIAWSLWSSVAWTALGSANVQTVALSFGPTSYAQMTGIPVMVFSRGLNTGPVTINFNGLGPVNVTTTGGFALSAGALSTGDPFQVVYNGSSFVLLTRTNSFTDAGNGGLVVASANNGARLLLLGNGGTTPNKTIAAQNGALVVKNSAASANILTVADNGDTTAGHLLRAVLGATGSGDPNAAALLLDFALTSTGGETTQNLPNGFAIKMGTANSITGVDDFYTYVSPFATQTICVICNEGNPTGWGATNANPTIHSAESNSRRDGFFWRTSRWGGSGFANAGAIAMRFVAIGD